MQTIDSVKLVAARLQKLGCYPLPGAVLTSLVEEHRVVVAAYAAESADRITAASIRSAFRAVERRKKTDSANAEKEG